MDLWSIGGGRAGVSLSWKLFGVMVFQRSMLSWWGVHQPEVFSVMVFHGSMVNWRREGWGHVYHVVVLVVHLPLFIHNYRWTTRTLYNNNSNIQMHLHKLLHIFLNNSSFDDDYSYVMLLLRFISSCTCTRTIAGQQQHATVTATTTTQSNLHKLLSVQDVIFPIQQLHMNTSSENMNSLQLWVSVCTFIWKVDQVVHFIWGVYLIWGYASSEKLRELFTSSERGVYLIWQYTNYTNIYIDLPSLV